MSKDGKILAFPEAAAKLTAPSKKSLFEKQKAEAEAKRQKEQLETAAVFEDFAKSFDAEEDNGFTPSNPRSTSGFPGSGGGPGAFSKRHFTGISGPPGRGMKSGPGSLGPAPYSSVRKRPFDDGSYLGRDSKPALSMFEENTAVSDTKAAFAASDDEDEKAASRSQERAVPKPTLHLSSLPPGMSPAAIKAILPSTLMVDAVRIMPGSSTGSERRSVSAIVTLAKDTPAGELDTVVNSLQNKYLGYGYYLSISRHLSSAVVGNSLPNSASASLPFGAKPTPQAAGRDFSRMQPPGPHRGGFAPPSSFAQTSRATPAFQVTVSPPSDLRQLKLIHKTVELLVTHGPEFEALLMSRPDVQREEKWAWIWDPTSPGGVWYRWRLWEVLTNRKPTGRARHDGAPQKIFGAGAPWVPQDSALPFEYTTSIEEFVSESDYNSSEDEDSGDEGRRRLHHLQGGAMPPDTSQGGADDDGPAYLNPLRKAKLIHLLSRLPDTTAKLRRGDVARVTAFAITHAGAGAEEVVELLVTNVHRPFALSISQKSGGKSATVGGNDGDSSEHENDQTPTVGLGTEAPEVNKRQQVAAEDTDPSPLKLIALYLISDILSSSSTSGVRHAWRYRQLFEASLQKHRTFEHLGRLDKQLRWGRLRAEKWKRSVGALLSLWEGWCCFSAGALEKFQEVFTNPPLSRAEEEEAKRAEEERKIGEKSKGRWKTITDEGAMAGQTVAGNETPHGDGMDVDATDLAAGEDVDGEPMDDDDDDENLDGEPMATDDDDDLDGEPMEEDKDDSGDVGGTTDPGQQAQAQREREHIEGKVGAGAAAAAVSTTTTTKDTNTNTGNAFKPRRRPKAEDMFADSDGE